METTMSNPFDMNALMGGVAQAVQGLKSKAAEIECEGTAGGGLVRVIATGDSTVKSITISDEAFEDKELLEDLVRAATNEALRKTREAIASEMGALAGGLPIPPGLF